MENNTTNNTQRKQFLVCNYGLDGASQPYAFHVEGNVGGKPFYKAGTNDKTSMISFSMGINRNAYSLLGRETEGDTPWITVVAFGDVADNLVELDLDVGAKVVVCGKVSEATYTKSDGTGEGKNIRIVADNVYMLACRVFAGGEPIKRFARATQTYTSRDGEQRRAAMVCLLGGKVVSATPVTEVNGQPTVSFDLEIESPAQEVEAFVHGNYKPGEDYGTYNRVRCHVWGARAQRLGKVLTIGNRLVVTGPISVREWNGRAYTNITVRELSVMQWATPAPSAAPQANPPASAPVDEAGTGTPVAPVASDVVSGDTDGAASFSSFMDDEDDDLPF